MLSEFAPFLVEIVSTQYDPDAKYHGDPEMINRYNILLGAKQAYADYWLRVKHRQEEELVADRVSSEVKFSFHKKDNKRSSETKK